MQEAENHTAQVQTESTEIHILTEAYYKELDPKKRKELLERMEEISVDECIGLKKALFESRYHTDQKTGTYADRYLLILIEFLHFFHSKPLLKNRQKRIIESMLAALGTQEALSYGREKEVFLHKELVNLCTRYLVTCTKSGYRKKIFGMMEPGEEERQAHICKDAYAMSYGIAEQYGLQKEAEGLCKAMNEAYCHFNEQAVSLRDVYRKMV